MNKKTRQLKKDLYEFVNDGNVGDELSLIIQNALMRIEDKRFDIEEAKDYILSWALKLRDKGYKFSEYEATLYELVKSKPYKMNFASSLALSIISIFR